MLLDLRSMIMGERAALDFAKMQRRATNMVRTTPVLS
jgi:hypothetical protein